MISKGSSNTERRSEALSVSAHRSKTNTRARRHSHYSPFNTWRLSKPKEDSAQSEPEKAASTVPSSPRVRQAQHELPLLREALLDSRYLSSLPLPRDTDPSCLITIVSPNRLRVYADVRACRIHLWGLRCPAWPRHTECRRIFTPDKLPTKTPQHARDSDLGSLMSPVRGKRCPGGQAMGADEVQSVESQGS